MGFTPAGPSPKPIPSRGSRSWIPYTAAAQVPVPVRGAPRGACCHHLRCKLQPNHRPTMIGKHVCCARSMRQKGPWPDHMSLYLFGTPHHGDKKKKIMHMFGRIASGEQLELHWWLRNADGLTDDKKRLYFACQRLITTPSVQQHFDSAVDHAPPRPNRLTR